MDGSSIYSHHDPRRISGCVCVVATGDGNVYAQGILTHHMAAVAEPYQAQGIPASMVGSTFYK